MDDFVVRLDELGCGPRFGSGGEVSFRCPIHDDHNPSANMCEADNGKVLAWCHACGDETYFDQLRALLFDGVSGDYRPSAERLATVKSRPPLVFEPSGNSDDDYFYWYPDGTPLLKRRGRRLDPETGKVVREKSFQWLRWINGQWTKWREPTRVEAPMLYGTHPSAASNQIEKAIASGDTLYVVEGEKDANRLISRGIPVVSPRQRRVAQGMDRAARQGPEDRRDRR